MTQRVLLTGASRGIGRAIGDPQGAMAQYFDRVRGRIKEAGLQHRFRLTGYVEEVEPLYFAADVVVHASIAPVTGGDRRKNTERLLDACLRELREETGVAVDGGPTQVGWFFALPGLTDQRVYVYAVTAPAAVLRCG